MRSGTSSAGNGPDAADPEGVRPGGTSSREGDTSGDDSGGDRTAGAGDPAAAEGSSGSSGAGGATRSGTGSSSGTESSGTGAPDGAGDGLTIDRGSLFSLRRVRRILGGLPAFGKLLFRLLGDRRVSLLDRAVFGAALVYLFVPIDLVPDWVPAFGQLDDLLIVLFTLDRLLYRTDPAVLADHWDGDDDSLAALRGLLERAAGVLPGWARALLRAG